MSKKKFVVETTFSSKDRLTATIDKMTKKFTDLGKKVVAFGRHRLAPLTPLVNRLRSDADALRKVGTTIKRVGELGFAAGQKIYGMVTDSTAALDQMAKTARRVGISGEFMQQLTILGDRSGVTFEELTDGMKTFIKNLGDAHRKTGPLEGLLGGPKGVAPDMLKALKDAKNVEDATMIALDGLARLDDKTKRVVFANALFGEIGSKLQLMSENGMAAVQQLFENNKKRNIILSDADLSSAEKANDTIADVKDVFGSVEQRLSVAITRAAEPKLLHFLDWMEKNSQEFGAMIDKVGAGIVAAVEGIVTAGKWLIENSDALIDWAKVLGGVYLATMVIPALKTVVGLYTDIVGLAGRMVGKWMGGQLIPPVAPTVASTVADTAAKVGGGAVAAEGAAAAAGGTTARTLFGRIMLGAARVLGPVGAVASAFDAQPLSGGLDMNRREQGAFDPQIKSLSDWMNGRPPMRSRDELLYNRPREVAQEFNGAFASAMAPAKVVIDFINAPPGMVVKSTTAPAGQSVDVTTKRGRRQLDPLGDR